MLKKNSVEVNFDGLVGPTHNYAGLALGNLASVTNARQESSPKKAVLQGLSKMKLLLDLGITQAVMPPQERPNIPLLRAVGFYGTDETVLSSSFREAPAIFAACYSSSNMWTANAATVSPSADTADGKLHFTPANLVTHFHRAQESAATCEVLRKIFADEKYFNVHSPLPANLQLADEGAANHTRFCQQYDSSGISLFVFGRRAFGKPAEGVSIHAPLRFPARQTLEAQESVVRRHQLLEGKTIYAKQNPAAIDQGVFHNDVISVGNQNVFFYHESAFENTFDVIDSLKLKVSYPIYLIPVTEKELSIAEAVACYIFNSQIVTLNNGTMAFIAPIEAQEMERAHAVLAHVLEGDNPIRSLHFVDCRQSMLNGGGPACLRLRVVLNEAERNACLQSVFLNEQLYEQLVAWVHRHYRDQLKPVDLLDPLLLNETKTALDDLTKILKLGNLYSFQQ